MCTRAAHTGLMSKDIDVFPSSLKIPTAGELSSRLWHLLQAHAGSGVVRAAFGGADVSDLGPLVELLDETPGRNRPARSSDPALLLSMPGYDYGWISLGTRRIGFDFYFREDDPESVREYILADIAPRGAGQPGLAGYPFEAAARAGRCWTMRLQATQPLAARLLAGFAAAALASLTAGFLWSGDGGADHHRMPASPATFLDWYPEWITGQMAG
jgi:hypothetical protein